MVKAKPCGMYGSILYKRDPPTPGCDVHRATHPLDQLRDIHSAPAFFSGAGVRLRSSTSFSSFSRSSPPSAMASSPALVALLAAVLGCAAAASAATTYTVGDTQGWTTGVDYSIWTSGKTFSEGDKLMFNYQSAAHTVTEVSKDSYGSCSSSSPISNDNNGPTTVTLTAGTHYYICAVGSHCSGGMKLAVTVGSAAGGTPGTTPSTTRPVAGASARVQAGGVAVFAAAALALALF